MITKPFIGFKNEKDNLLLKCFAYGCPPDIVRWESFRLDRYTRYINSYCKTGKLTQNSEQQIDLYNKVYANPFHDPYVYAISSEPSDVAAKMVGLKIMLNAVRLDRSTSHPQWHIVTGGYKDKLRDAYKGQPLQYSKDCPNLLILSNITINSTASKLEKVRDILELYSHIPRIVIMTGEDPLSFFSRTLCSPVNYTLYLAKSKINTI